MTSTRPNVLDRLAVLADHTRSRILLLVDRNEFAVTELCVALQLPQSTVSRHLKVLTDEGWIVARGEGTSRFYKMVPSLLDPEARALWKVVRAQASAAPGAAQDARRGESVLAKRREKVRLFFSSAAGAWDHMRREMIGERADLLALLELLDDGMTVADIGCGTGHIAAALAPCVSRVVAIDESGPMLASAKQRLSEFDNVDVRTGTIESLPMGDDEVDAAVVFLVAHFVTDPAAAMREVRRVLKPDGRLLVVDLMSHDRADYIVQLGHVWQGFDGDQVKEWLGDAGFTRCRYRELPVDPAAKGPSLFVASARKGNG